jgi:hypothetical protein
MQLGTRPSANAQGAGQTRHAAGRPATRSYDAKGLIFFGRVLYKSSMRGEEMLREIASAGL